MTGTEIRTSTPTQLLFRPFDRASGAQALAFGLVVIATTALLAARTGLQTDGVLDLHFATGLNSGQLLLQGLINWLSLGLALLISGRWLAGRDFSSLDLFATQAAARWPMLLSVLYLSIPPIGQRIRSLTAELIAAMPSEPGQVMADASHMLDAFLLTLLGVPLLVFIGWMVWLMFHGYQAVTRLRGLRAGLSFSAALIGAWVLSKLLMLLL